MFENYILLILSEASRATTALTSIAETQETILDDATFWIFLATSFSALFTFISTLAALYISHKSDKHIKKAREVDCIEKIINTLNKDVGSVKKEFIPIFDYVVSKVNESRRPCDENFKKMIKSHLSNGPTISSSGVVKKFSCFSDITNKNNALLYSEILGFEEELIKTFYSNLEKLNFEILEIYCKNYARPSKQKTPKKDILLGLYGKADEKLNEIRKNLVEKIK